MLDVFQARGHNQVDSCRLYNEGISEEYLAAFEWEKGGLAADTKFYPTQGRSGLDVEFGGVEKREVWHVVFAWTGSRNAN
ncbi:hypothetical protein HYALB_00011357 [Hymenoscyphus albidus]|uniref:NADP-dependent oxidoreductase domain-containing protein n=1 Tax=Hymenoscyphus albidus TaxID=595503 RepID=A0A9N9LP84_9HELO|nr:hypothetical protein HYALB_00011357 [Hymenoscyphus albidus]